MARYEDKLEQRVTNMLGDFNQQKESELVGCMFDGSHKYDIDIGDYDENRLIRYLFVKFMGFIVWDQPFEKVNWEIPMRYKELNISFTHEKFGFRLYIDKIISQTESGDLSKEIIKKITVCLKLVEPLIRNEGLRSLENGRVIVENKLREIEKEFHFFINESRRKKKRANMPEAIKLSDIKRRINYKLELESEYLANSAYISFFSLIEHLCILGLAFTTSDERSNFSSFAQKNWQDKFKVVFPMNNPQMFTFYNQLVELAKYRRNPIAHGQLDKLHTIFHFYVPEARNRIPMGLYDRELHWKLQNNGNLDTLEAFLLFIRKNQTTKKWLQYLKKGFDISYVPSTLLEYQEYIKSTAVVRKSHLDYMSKLEDDLGNMDW